MSWQLAEEIPHWEEEMDKLLIMNAVVGQTYKKTYYDPTTEKIQSCLVYPENFIIDYWARSIESCMRYSEIHEMTKQEIEEYVRREYFLDVDLGTPTGEKAIPQSEKPNSQQKTVNDFTTPFNIIEQHTWLDLDDDGLREPYMVWFEYNSGKILRIQVRYSPDDIDVEGKKVLGFKPHCHYTKFGFIPNPDGSFFDMGFGHLLGPLNEAVNTNINQLTDAGTLNNLQAGFISKGLRIKMADTAWHPGEWKSVNATADDLRKQIVPLPSKEPSAVLFQLLNLLITSGKELASVAEIFVGKMPGQNTPATTTMASIEQGMKVFTAVYKRIYRSLASEYKKIFYLNSYYLDPKTYGKVLDEPINPEDFNDDEYDVCPSADPTATTQTEKLAKAQGLMELLGTGLIDPQKVIMRVLQAQEQPNWEELIPGLQQTGQPTPPQEKPDPKVEAIRMKAETDARLGEARVAELQKKSELEQRSKEAELAMKQQDHQEERVHKMQMAQLETRAQAQKNNIFLAQAQNKAATEAVANKQKLVQNEQTHQQKLKQSKETAKSKQSQKPSSKSGKKTP
jgi:chaperonin GroES